LANFLTVNLTFSLVFVNLILKVRGYFEWKIVVDNMRWDEQSEAAPPSLLKRSGPGG
jgi:hypothetical protein